MHGVFAQSGGSGSSIPFDKTGVRGKLTFDTFGCDVFQENPPTPDRLKPDVFRVFDIMRKIDLTAPDGKRLEFWVFADPNSPKPAERNGVYPGPVFRVREGQVIHTRIQSHTNTHTIHHHGIEPTTFNDGVGHLSFEVSGHYDYQWRAAEAGTFFYHCHKNTVLHFEMGLFGFLIVDPPEGPGRLFRNGPAYDVEALWAAGDVDPRWRLLNHDAGLCGEDVGLNIHQPKYFTLSGVFAPKTLDDPRVMVKARLGQRILIRLLNASYSILRTTLGVQATVVGVDGRGLGHPDRPWGRPFVIPAGQPFELTSAQRWDLLIAPPAKGTFKARIQYLDWITRAVQAGGKGVVETKIVVS